MSLRRYKKTLEVLNAEFSNKLKDFLIFLVTLKKIVLRLFITLQASKAIGIPMAKIVDKVIAGKKLIQMGLKIVATQGTAKVLSENNVSVAPVLKATEGRPNIVDHIKNNEIQLVINTTEGKVAQETSYSIGARRWCTVSPISQPLPVR